MVFVLHIGSSTSVMNGTKQSAEGIKVDGSTVKLEDDAMSSIYGSHNVDQGSYSWKIKFVTDIRWICFGIINDDEEVLEKYRYRNDYDGIEGGHLYTTGTFYSGEGCKAIYSYSDFIRDKDTIIEMTLNMDEKSLNYKINGKDHGIVAYPLTKDKYRMVINLCWESNIIELL